MPVPVSKPGGHAPTTFDKMRMGAMMGGTVGLCIGFIFGGYNMLKHGPGPNGFIRNLAQYMLGSAATFGFFMSIGTAIRTESSLKSPILCQAIVSSRGTPVLLDNSKEQVHRKRP